MKKLIYLVAVILLAIVGCTLTSEPEIIDEIVQKEVKDTTYVYHDISDMAVEYNHNTGIWEIRLTLKTGVTVYGQVQQPSAWLISDGEFHVTANGGSGDFEYMIIFPTGGWIQNLTGDFYMLGPGWYDWAVIENTTTNIVVHVYPSFSICWPPASLSNKEDWVPGGVNPFSKDHKNPENFGSFGSGGTGTKP